jgi:predicted MFS family arabinose efflux permease
MTLNSWKAFTAMLIFTMGTSIITPLIPLYATKFDLGAGTLTLLFATYTATVVPVMLLMGNLSDRIGRKRVMLPAMLAISLASLLFAFAESVPLLFAGRVLQGIAIGGFLGVGAAFVVDHAAPHRRARAALWASVGFRLGFGLGPGLAGLVSEYTDRSIHTPFQGHLALMVVAIGAVLIAPETVPRRRARLEVKIGIPEGQGKGFATFLGPAGFLLSYLDAALLALVPLYIARTLEVDSVIVPGLVGFLILGMGGLTPLVLGRVEPRRGMMIGVAISSVSSILVLAAAAVIGFTNGLILQGGTAICGITVPLHDRGKLISAFYMCCYSGTIPIVGIGYLSHSVGLTAALSVWAGFGLVLAAFVLFVGGRVFRRVTPYVEPVPPDPVAA